MTRFGDFFTFKEFLTSFGHFSAVNFVCSKVLNLFRHIFMLLGVFYCCKSNLAIWSHWFEMNNVRARPTPVVASGRY